MGTLVQARRSTLAFFLTTSIAALALLALGAASADATQAPIAAYSFDAGEGTVAEDVAGEHDGTIEGATWSARGKFGQALEFDGANDCLSIPNAEDLQLPEEFTLEAWVRPQGPGSSEPILVKETPGWFGYMLYLGLDTSGHLEGYLGEEGEVTRGGEDPSPAAKDAWSHVALSFDGAQMRLYVNGEEVDGSAAAGPMPSTGQLSIGCSKEGEEHFEGKIDEVRIYDRALDAAEVATDMASGLQTPPAGPVAAYAFEEAEGTVAHDYAGGHDATIEGATWTKGKFGGALDFDSAGEDVVTIPTSEDLNLEDFTLEAWVRPADIHADAAVIAKTDPEAYGYELVAADHENEVPSAYITEGKWVHRYAYSEDRLDENAWTHLAATSDGEVLRFYVDGALVDTRAGANVIAGGEAALQIGGNDPFGEFFDGKIDEVRIYDRALSEAEIATDLHSGIEVPQKSPIAAYSFDAGEGTVAEDVAGEHDGTIEGATWSARGKYGGALQFDGTDDCVQVPESAEFQFLENEEFTLEAWVRPQDEGIEGVVSQEDDASAPWEEPFSYSMLVGGEEGPKGWLRKGGESGHEGVQAPEPLPLETWSHLAFTDDGARMRIYVDGELAGSWPAPTLTPAEGPLAIGCIDSYGNYFKGRIDEVRVYDRVLDEAEIGADLDVGLEAPRQGPVAAYAFEEAEGTVAHDYAGGHDATIEGATWTRGKFGGALDFDSAEEDVVTIPTSSDLNLEDFTLEAWVRPADIHADAAVIAKTDPEAYGYELVAADHENEVPSAYITEGKWVHRYAYSEDRLDENAWTHLAATSDGEVLRFYVDGHLVDTRAGANVIAGGEAALQIGGNDPFGEFFDGKIDEVRIYDRALSEAEIATDLHSGIEVPQKSPIAAYSFDAGEGSILEDLTGNGHDGTIAGATWSPRGKYGGALQFDGENDCVQIPESAEFQFLEAEEFTLEAWVRPQGEGIEALVTQEDDANAEWEDPFSYSMLVGGEEGPKGWLREGGGSGRQGVQAPDPLPLHAWSHLAVADDGARLRIYVNGEKVDSVPTIPLSAAEGPLTIGCLANYGNYFEGRIDEVRIYDRALDGTEIGADMGSTFPVAVTEMAEEVEANEAIMTGTTHVHGEETEYYFEYGPTTSYGSVVTGEEIDGNGNDVEVEDVAINLAPETTYHYRLVAEGPLGTNYGKDMTFTTGKRSRTVQEEEEEASAEEAPSEEEPVQPLAKLTPATFFGMMWTGNISQMVRAKAFNAIENSGAKMVRFVVAPGAEVAKAFNQASSHNLVALPYLGSGPFPKPGTTAATNFINFAKKQIETYGPGTSYDTDTWEIWNEPNMRFQLNPGQKPPIYEDAQVQGNVRPAEFAAFYKELVKGIRSVSSGVHIMAPGLFGYKSNVKEHLTPRAFLKQFNEALNAMPKLENPYGMVSLHPYVFKTRDPGKKGQKAHVPKNEADAIQIRKEVKGMISGVHSLEKHMLGESKPIWITELGFPVRSEEDGKPSKKIPAVDPLEQKLLLRQSFWALLHSPARLEIEHAFYYNIEDRPAEIPGEHGGSWDHHSGLLKEDHQPRPSWTAFSNLAGGKECPHSAPC